eukprot:UN25816
MSTTNLTGCYRDNINLLFAGYFRHAPLKKLIPCELSAFCEQFYDKTFHWTFSRGSQVLEFSHADMQTTAWPKIGHRILLSNGIEGTVAKFGAIYSKELIGIQPDQSHTNNNNNHHNSHLSPQNKQSFSSLSSSSMSNLHNSNPIPTRSTNIHSTRTHSSSLPFLPSTTTNNDLNTNLSSSISASSLPSHSDTVANLSPSSFSQPPP